MGFETRINVNGHGYGNGHGNGYDNGGYEERENGGDNSPRRNGNMFAASSSSSSSSSSSPKRCIEHHVSKLDTLAGVAIRYGVEVADIKKMNGLVTDLQMFALKTLQIPLPGRHPPSPCLSNGHSGSGPCSSEQTSSSPMHSDILDSFQSLRLTPERKISPAMCSLRDFYGLNDRRNSDGCEMAVYSKGTTSYCEHDTFSSPLSLMNPPLSHHRRSRSVANGFKSEEDELISDADSSYRKWIDKLNLRLQKPQTDIARTPEKLLKEENGSGSWASSNITRNNLALRNKGSSRTNLASEAEAGSANGFPFTLGESFVGESSSVVRKSSSTPSLQEQDGNGSLSIWSSSKWSLKPDLQAALANPIFDGLSKPITGRRKAALD